MPRRTETLKDAWSDEDAVETAVVVYDPESGAVRHVHREIVMPGGRPTPPARLAQRALQLAKAARPGGAAGKGKLAALQVKPTLLRPGEGLRVEKGRLVRVKVPAAKAAGGSKPRRTRGGR